jgi:hypothetical protein
MVVAAELGAVGIIVMLLLAVARLKVLHCDVTQGIIDTSTGTDGVHLHIVLDGTLQQGLQT